MLTPSVAVTVCAKGPLRLTVSYLSSSEESFSIQQHAAVDQSTIQAVLNWAIKKAYVDGLQDAAKTIEQRIKGKT